MDLEDYMRNENIKELKITQIDSELKKVFGEKVFDNFDKKVDKLIAYQNDEAISEFYNFLAENSMHDFFQGTMYSQSKINMTYLSEQIQNHKNVLDIGCNSGFRTTYYALNHPETKFTGIDISDKSIEIAKKRIEKYNLTNITFLHQNFLDMAPEPKFDFVLADHCLHESITTDIYGQKNPAYPYKIGKIYDQMTQGKLIIVLNPDDVYFYMQFMPPLLENAGYKFESIKEMPFQKYEETRIDLAFIANKLN